MTNYTDLKSRRRMGGIKAKAYGQMFEQIFLLNCRRYQIGVTQIPDSCKQLTQHKIIRVKSPFDFVLTYAGKSAVLDTKTTEHDTFSRSDIVEHQVRELFTHEQAGGLGGYVIWFRAADRIIFIPASALGGKGDSINDQNPRAILLGSSHDFQLVRLFQKP